MKIELRALGVPVSTALEGHIFLRLDFALRRFAGRVDRVVIRLVDLNGPKGGLDKRCRITARLARRAPSVIVEATDADAYAAVSQAAARLDEQITRTFVRQREMTKHRRRTARRYESSTQKPSRPPDSVRPEIPLRQN